MPKKKLQRFEETKTFSHVIEPLYSDVLNKNYPLKGKWNKDFFKNQNPIVLELACGKGEYSVGLAQLFPEKNFIGIDIKGARLWYGAKYALENKLNNVCFLRTQIEFINSFFEEDEVSEIWITFPDPQLKKPKKRLTSSRFLSSYKKLLKPDGTINLKTDSTTLHEYTLAVIELNNLSLQTDTSDLYNSEHCTEVLSIRTFYEKQWLKNGKKIKYLKFRLNGADSFVDPKIEEDNG